MPDTRQDAAMGSSLAERIIAVNNQSPETSSEREPATPHRAISTELSADEMLLVRAAGYEACGIVVGAAVFHVGLVGARMANVELLPLSQALLAAREQATARMRDRAARLGAAGVLGVHLEIDAFEDKHHLAKVVAVGTAVTESAAPGRETGAADPFMAGMSGQEFSVLVAGGYAPVNVVMGVCVYHIARQRPRAVLRNLTTTAELGTYTAALYEARELAVRRLQEEALASGGEGVVGMAISQNSHVWGSNTIEFFCMGTTVRRRDDSRLAEPKTALFLRDQHTTTDPAALHGSARRKAMKGGG